MCWISDSITLINVINSCAYEITDPRSLFENTVKPVYNDHLYNNIYYLGFIQ